MKNITLILIALFTFHFAVGQPKKIAELTFEEPGGYSTSIPEFTDNDRDYFIRTDESNFTGEDVTNIQGDYYFATQDIDGEGATLPVYLHINNINISGYENLEFRIFLAEDESGDGEDDWDGSGSAPDYVDIKYDIDKSSVFTNLISIRASSDVQNTYPSIDTDGDGLGDGTLLITNTFAQFTENIADTGELLDVEIEISLNSEDEDIAIDNIEIWGTQIACAPAVTWDGTAWSNGAEPDITTAAELNADYDTSLGSFSACTLILNNADLNIADGTYVEVQNELIVDAGSSIYVQPRGAFVQNNDLSINNISGNIFVDKETAPMNAWYEYTYWSSPVAGTEFANAIDQSHPERRFIFNGQNFLDAFAESNNNNESVSGQDDIDDNGNDWKWVSGNTVMEPGIGYASTLTKFDYDTNPQPFNKTFRFTFEGDFNNGKYTIPIYRNDSELDDTNWNFIGNPYPSAIDADLFLAANSNLDGAIFLWSQNTAPSATTNGNQQINFSNDDYAIINVTGTTPGGDGIPPSRYIPSGQGFFVSMSNSASADLVSGSVYKSNIVFSNSMRVADVTANNLFFKGSKKEKKSEKNKLWLDLTSNNGVFNQILIGYVNGASINDDGLAYDAPKYPTKGAALYSIIEGSNKKFAIQGKPTNSINEDETIKLGFKTTINVATLYTLSIAKMEGDFLNSHSVFVKDNLLNKVHDLTVCDYTFTSETGQFNSRFEITFKADALSTNNTSAIASQLKIVELENDNVQFTAPNGLRIKSVSVFDLFGRQLYEFKGQNETEIFKLSNLNASMFLAKVVLSNGAVIDKKAIKK